MGVRPYRRVAFDIIDRREKINIKNWFSFFYVKKSMIFKKSNMLRIVKT